MKPESSFKESVERVWSTIGFVAIGNAFSRRHADLATLIAVERGFVWIRALGRQMPDRAAAG
jgi:hypothetical protein